MYKINKQCESPAKSESFAHNLFYINNINYFKQHLINQYHSYFPKNYY